MLGSKALSTLALVAIATLASAAADVLVAPLSSNTTSAIANTTTETTVVPTTTTTTPTTSTPSARIEGFDKAVEKLATFFHVLEPNATEIEKAGFEKAVEQLAIAYNVPLAASPTASEVASGVGKFPSIEADRSSNARASKCTLSASASDTQLIELGCASNKIRFVGIGDWGEKSASAALNAVRDGILAESANIDFVLNAGDNFYSMGVSSTTDKQWTNSWYKRYSIGSKLTVPWFSVLGNHDHYGNADAQIEFSKSTQPGAKYWIMPDKFYSIDVTGASGKKFKLVLTDTITVNESDLEWVTSQVQDASAEFVLAVGHYHVYSQGGRGDNSDKNMKKLDDIWTANPKVKAYICGHEHDMQLLRANGIDYSLIGGGGRAIDFGDKSPGTKAEQVYYARNYGYAVYDVDLSARTITTTYNVFNKAGAKVETKSFARSF